MDFVNQFQLAALKRKLEDESDDDRKDDSKDDYVYHPHHNARHYSPRELKERADRAIVIGVVTTIIIVVEVFVFTHFF